MIATCPDCGESLRQRDGGVTSLACPVCGRVIPVESPRPVRAPDQGRVENAKDVLRCPFCRDVVGVNEQECSWCGESLATERLLEERSGLLAERDWHVLLGVMYAAVGGVFFMLLIMITEHAVRTARPVHPLAPPACVLLGAAFFCTGFSCFAASRGQHRAIGVLGIFALFPILCLPDRIGGQLSRLRLILQARGVVRKKGANPQPRSLAGSIHQAVEKGAQT